MKVCKEKRVKAFYEQSRETRVYAREDHVNLNVSYR